MPEGLRIELLRRLTTLSPSASGEPDVVWDARVVDKRGHVLSACDHGHHETAEAQECGEAQLEELRRR